jgi:hypothetical protein
MVGPSHMDAFTPTRVYPRAAAALRFALVVDVSTIGEDPPLRHIRNVFTRWWPGWRRRFLPRVPYLLLVLVVERHPNMTLDGVGTLLNLTRVDCSASRTLASACALCRSLDSGYEIFTPSGQPGDFFVLLTLMTFPTPSWVAPGTIEEVARTWRDPTVHFPYQYIAMNVWYAHPLFKLQLLDYFDYWVKVDLDVGWAAPFPHDLRRVVADSEALFFHTQLMHDPKPITRGLREVRNDFMAHERSRCRAPVRPRARGAAFFEDVSSAFYGNFIGGWLGFFTSPEVLAFGHHWYNATDLWRNRWGDQQFWCQAIGLFHNGSRTLDLTHWRDSLFWHGRCKGCPPAALGGPAGRERATDVATLLRHPSATDAIASHGQQLRAVKDQFHHAAAVFRKRRTVDPLVRRAVAALPDPLRRRLGHNETLRQSTMRGLLVALLAVNESSTSWVDSVTLALEAGLTDEDCYQLRLAWEEAVASAALKRSRSAHPPAWGLAFALLGELTDLLRTLRGPSMSPADRSDRTPPMDDDPAY